MAPCDRPLIRVLEPTAWQAHRLHTAVSSVQGVSHSRLPTTSRSQSTPPDPTRGNISIDILYQRLPLSTKFRVSSYQRCARSRSSHRPFITASDSRPGLSVPSANTGSTKPAQRHASTSAVKASQAATLCLARNLTNPSAVRPAYPPTQLPTHMQNLYARQANARTLCSPCAMPLPIYLFANSNNRLLFLYLHTGEMPTRDSTA